MSIERFLSRTIVLQASAGGLKYNITQISFIARDGSLIVSFPYGKHSSGLLSSGSHATLRWREVDSNFQYAGAATDNGIEMIASPG